ncbi:hypothetical protein [Sphingomonas morindae]|uniref:Uncharacterized protein n=1 Tax=Sphingomonas morindae TaxID=1541170 RepID=A0ABY4XCS6_9SPHN|nr:hypothetical protein [Sphingomonas morindae]USI74762.1 hypothetical protein LHA26_18605 [Sphingomonas morindae]
MRGGFWVMAIFATGWAVAGLHAAGFPPIALAVPVLISLLILAAAHARPQPATQGTPQRGRTIARWSLVEGAAIAAAAMLLPRLHHRDALFPVVALIVGAHFLPLARALPVRLYYATGLGLMLIGLIGFALPAPMRPLAVGLGAAAMLWGTGLARLIAPAAPTATQAPTAPA